ncbi:MAG: hypothetical protein M0Z66_03650 [Thermaerobacter sp.]|nr:hypothetical protein [Thermaerobacter sp.]
MIVRILHEGQYELSAEALGRLRKLDDELMEAVAAGDEKAFAARRDALVGMVRSEGKVVGADVLRESDLVVPYADISLEEAQKLFTQHA